jgi:hypothetical protein
VAACAAAALLLLPGLVFLFGASGPHPGVDALVAASLAAIAVYVYAADARAAALGVAVAAGALNTVAMLGVVFLVLVGGDCENGHVPALAWVVAPALYLAGAAWGLQRGRNAVWVVPVALVASGALLVALATALTGSTGACLE